MIEVTITGLLVSAFLTLAVLLFLGFRISTVEKQRDLATTALKKTNELAKASVEASQKLLTLREEDLKKAQDQQKEALTTIEDMKTITNADREYIIHMEDKLVQLESKLKEQLKKAKEQLKKAKSKPMYKVSITAKKSSKKKRK